MITDTFVKYVEHKYSIIIEINEVKKIICVKKKGTTGENVSNNLYFKITENLDVIKYLDVFEDWSVLVDKKGFCKMVAEHFSISENELISTL